jgi:aldehyde dehydrogenase (NAD+)
MSSTFTTDREMSPQLRGLVAPGNFIDGRWIDDSDAQIDVLDPYTEGVLAQIPQASTSDVQAAVAAAREAFDHGPWPRLSPRERSAIMARLAERVAAHGEALTELGVFEIGSPIVLSRALHAGGPIQFLEYWADMALKGPHGRFEEGLPMIDNGATVSASMLFQEPVGVVASVVAYNYPLMLIAFKVAGALAAGCTTVLMPSPRAPLSSIAFTRIAEEVGIPPGVVNLVVGGADAAQALTESPGVDMVSFTGSVAVGRKVMAQAANGLKRVVLELGGKSPNIVLPGADVDSTVAPSILRFTRNSGQGCGATTRVLLPRENLDQFTEAAGRFMDGLVVGDPWSEDTDVGPLIRGEQVRSVQGYVDRALESGAEAVAQGPSVPDRGFFFTPMLFGGVDNDSELCQEELFGPVGAVVPYDSVQDAVAMANASRYGLNATVWGPTDQAMRVARQLRSGTVALNGGGPERPDAPWSGYGESSVGAERGEAGFAEFFQVKHVHWPLAGTSKPPGVR